MPRVARAGVTANGRDDHASFSILNKDGSPTPFNREGGIILRSSVPFACSFAADGGTQEISTTPRADS